MSNEKKICDYFLISGFSKTRKPYDLSQIYHQGEEICNANVESATDFFHYKEPIVDIEIVSMNPRDRPPADFHVVDRTHSKQNKADLNGKASVDELYLCFKYGRDKPPITDIWAFNPKQKNISQDGWDLIEKTKNGSHSANLHTSSSNPLYVAYKRAKDSAPADNLVVTDICVILTNKGELCPPAYTRVDVPIKRTPLSHTLNICYKKSSVKQHVLTYQPEIIYCLPSVSIQPIVDVYNPAKDSCRGPGSLPEDIHDVANFCMPWGATLECWSSKMRTPRPSFVPFVLTNVNYERMYGAAMLFYEEFEENELTEEEAVSLGLRGEGRADMKVFASKSICLLSRWPLFQTFKRVLSFLIREDERQRSGIVASSCPFQLPLERFISQFLHCVPFPTTEAPNILLQWDLENPIGIQLPTDAISKCGTGDNFYHLVRMLDVEKIIQLFVYMLTEQKILLTSTCNSDLTSIAEALISMIFPFKWSVVYIPFLYLSCIHIIQSPSPYVIGVDSRFFDYFRLPEGVGCVDLINKSIKPPDVTSKYLDYNKVLPKNVLKSLTNGLNNCKVKVMSFEKQQSLRKTTGNLIDEFTILRKKEVIGESIRECFLRAVVLMFKNYQKYLVPQSYRQKEDDMFDVDGFLKSVDRASRPLYQAIFDTQLWNHFIMERSYATEFDDSLAFFDRCIKMLQSMDEEQGNACSLLHTDSVIKSEHTKVVPPPDPVDGWAGVQGSRSSFPRTLDTSLMLASIHGDSSGVCVSRHGVADDSYLLTTMQDQQHQTDHGSTASLASPDSSIPVLHIRAIDASLRRPTKATVLKRPFEELKQARHLGNEAKRGPTHAWAAHLLSSSYCLWYLSLPGLVGYVLDTPGLRESGLADRILELAVEMLDSLAAYRLPLPDEVCLRVLLLLVHQIKPSRLRVNDIRKHADLNAFSYGLCNQILLEEETQLTQMANLKTHLDQSELGDVEKSESPCNNNNDGKDEKDCDSGRETLESNINTSTGQLENMKEVVNETPEVPDITNTTTGGTSVVEDTGELCSMEVGGRHVRLRGQQQVTRKKNDRMSQLLFHSPMETCTLDIDRSHQFFDQSAGIIMSSTKPSGLVVTRDEDDDGEEAESTQALPVLAMHRSPAQALTDTHNTESLAPPIILKSPFSEEKSELHAIYLTRRSGQEEEREDSSDSEDKGRGTPDSRLTQSDLVASHISSKTRASFRQLKSVANKSLRSMRTMMSSVGSGTWLSPGDSAWPAVSPVSQGRVSSGSQFGMPATFKPWEQQTNNHGNKIGRQQSRLKTTASADLLDTMSGAGGEEGEHRVTVASRPCAGTVQQLRRQRNLGGGGGGGIGPWANSGSSESFCSEQRYSSTTSLDTEASVPSVDKLWEKITDSLAAVQLPMGKYWPEDEDQGDQGAPSPSVECSQRLSVTMTTCTECTHCHYMIYDDDTMSGWSYDDSDLQSACAYCENRFTPKLTFQVFIDHIEPESPRSPRNGMHRNTLAYKSQINYLSPFVLRKELESVLQQEGELALLRPNFLQEHGILYWNLVWYYSRLSLPSHILSFLTLWLREKGRALAEVSEDNVPKYNILTSLTGHEQVLVHQVWELPQLSGRVGLPLYRKYIAAIQSNAVGGLVGPTNSPSRSSLDQIVDFLFNNNVGHAIEALLAQRSYYRSEIGGVSGLPLISCDRSAYRELMHLAIVALSRYSLNLEAFHHMYETHWAQLVRSHHGLDKAHDRPPTLSSFYCRKVFRPLMLM